MIEREWNVKFTEFLQATLVDRLVTPLFWIWHDGCVSITNNTCNIDVPCNPQALPELSNNADWRFVRIFVIEKLLRLWLYGRNSLVFPRLFHGEVIFQLMFIWDRRIVSPNRDYFHLVQEPRITTVEVLRKKSL